MLTFLGLLVVVAKKLANFTIRQDLFIVVGILFGATTFAVADFSFEGTFPTISFLNYKDNVLFESYEKTIKTEHFIARSRQIGLETSVDHPVFVFTHMARSQLTETSRLLVR